MLEANPSTVVVVNAATAVDMSWAREASTVLYAWFPGEAFGPALVDVLSGAREPGGRLPISIGRRHEDYAAWDTTPVDGRLEYPESVFVGYRHFDAAGIEPEFCFGHGLGYGAWEYEGLELSTPELTSTAHGRTRSTPSITFAGLNPPDKTTGAGTLGGMTDQSKTFPPPPYPST